jgi:AcrR family transcriptional regulator
MRLFTVHGYDRTTTREIAAAAGANVSLIARYFGSKDGLYAEVLQASAGTLDAQESADLVGDIITGLRQDAWPEFGGEHPLLLLLQPDATDDRTAELRRRALTRTINRLARQVAPEAPAQDPAARLRGAVMLALVAGVTALHAAMPDDPFSAADEMTLRGVLRDAVAGIGGSGAAAAP